MSKPTTAEIVRALKGLLKIAEIAMPDSYFQTDSRVRRAQKLLEALKVSQ